MRKKRTTINISLEAKSQLDTSKWQGYVGIVPAVYRGFAFAIGAAQIFLFPTAYQSVIPAILVVSAVGTYSLLKAFYPLRWYFEDSGLSGTGWVGENKEDKMSKTGEKPEKGTYLFFALQPFAGE